MLLYLITDGKFHKIGITNRSIQVRIKQLQTGNPYELKLIKVVNCGSEKHAQEMEKFYHNKYYEYRMQGEWFDFKKLKPINIYDIIIMFNIFSDASVINIPFGLASTPRFKRRKVSLFLRRRVMSRAIANIPVTFWF